MSELQESGKKYSPDEVRSILERAVTRSSKTGDPTAVSYDELIETARELDISEQDLAQAIEEHERTYALEDARERWLVRRKQKFYEHLRSYLIVNAVLMTIDLVTSGGVWFFWPLFGWGIGLAFDASEAFFPKEKDIDRGARKLLRKERKQALRERREEERIRRHESRLESRSDRHRSKSSKNIMLDTKRKKLIIESGERRIEIG